MDKLNGADNSVLKTCAENLLETIDRCAERSAAYQRSGSSVGHLGCK